MRLIWAAGLVVALTAAMVAPAAGADVLLRAASPVVVIDDVPPLSSGNVTYHGTIPLDSPGVGGQVVNHANGKKYFYVTGAKGLSIYDVADPALPIPVSFTPFPHAQNEDLKVSEDGTRAMIAADGSILVPIAPTSPGIHLFDTSDPANPTMIGSTAPLWNGTGTGTGTSEHTAECAVPDCSVIYGRTGRIYDATDLPVIADTGERWNINPDTGAPVRQAHALNRDEAGIVSADTTPRLILDPREDPLNPTVLAIGNLSADDTRLQHNNRRPDALQWQPRGAEDVMETVTVDAAAYPRSISVTDTRPVMRPGELLISNSESNLNPGCSNAGALSTWSIIDFDKGAKMQPLEVFRPLNGTLVDGSPAANALGCSGHWFTENDGVVAASWYEHGVRFFDVDSAVGTIREVGYFQPGVTEAGASYWVDDSFVYNVDYARGIDIISFDRAAAVPAQQELDAAWMASMNRDAGPLAAAERLACRLATTD
jgi:hypothetical protein